MQPPRIAWPLRANFTQPEASGAFCISRYLAANRRAREASARINYRLSPFVPTAYIPAREAHWTWYPYALTGSFARNARSRRPSVRPVSREAPAGDFAVRTFPVAIRQIFLRHIRARRSAQQCITDVPDNCKFAYCPLSYLPVSHVTWLRFVNARCYYRRSAAT